MELQGGGSCSWEEVWGGQDAMGPRAGEGGQGLALLRTQRAVEQGGTAFRPLDAPGQGPSSASGAQDTLGWRKPLLPLSLLLRSASQHSEDRAAPHPCFDPSLLRLGGSETSLSWGGRGRLQGDGRRGTQTQSNSGTGS